MARPRPPSGYGEENGVHVTDEEMDEERITTYKVGLHLLVSERYGALNVRYYEITLLKYNRHFVV